MRHTAVNSFVAASPDELVELVAPLLFDPVRAVRMQAAVQGSGLLFALTHTYTGYPMVIEARERIAARTLGDIRRVHVTYLQDWLSRDEDTTGSKQASWRNDPSRSGEAGAFADIGTHAFNLGRYSQSVSVVKALKQGIGGKIQKSLQRTLKLQPDHAEAHTAMGLYHAEILDKVGKLIGSMTYGASADKAMTHFKRSLELTPESPIAKIEYANGLYMLFGDDRYDEVSDLYVAAAEATPFDAMERLDVEAARAELE